ncbi:Uncharacterised protein [Mycobacteroides abscessus subsp. massiliense]|nr:Uncharacterised protein [Mycobacteroides abscessus subsp. massiliense]
MQVAALAHGAQVLIPAVLGGVVQVRHGQHDAAAGAVCGLSVDVRAAVEVCTPQALALALTAALGALETDAA